MTKDVNSKYTEMLNEMLSAENAAIDRIQSRLNTPLQEKINCNIIYKKTQNKQDRLRQLITKLGRDPTDAKADLPKLMPPTTMMMKKAIKDTFKSVTDDKTDNPLPEEMDLMEIKQDAIAEGAEVKGYEALIAITQKSSNLPQNDIIPLLKQSLQEEESLKQWYRENTPIAIDNLWPNIQSAVVKS